MAKQNTQLPPLDSLRCFVEAARCLNFRVAARTVALSPAALGQRIKQLEDDFGVELFHRTTRSVQLTSAGARLLPAAKETLESAERCADAARGTTDHFPMNVDIGTRHELGLSWLLPALEAYETVRPELTAHLYFGAAHDLHSRVRSLALDCAITSSRIHDPRLRGEALHEERYAFVSQTELLRSNPVASPTDFGSHTLFDTTDDLPLFSYWRDAEGGADSLAFARVVRLGTIAAIRRQVLRGKGIAVLPEYFVRKDLEAGRLEVVLPDVEPGTDEFRLVHRRDDPRRNVWVDLAEFLRHRPLL